jgi:hypothetical protein
MRFLQQSVAPPTETRALRAQQKGFHMSANRVRLSKVLTGVSEKLNGLDKKDAGNIRKAFDAAVLACSDADGACDGVKLLGKLPGVVEACPTGNAREALQSAVDYIHDERSFRGDLWCREALALTLREGVKLFAAAVAG